MVWAPPGGRKRGHWPASGTDESCFGVQGGKVHPSKNHVSNLALVQLELLFGFPEMADGHYQFLTFSDHRSKEYPVHVQ